MFCYRAATPPLRLRSETHIFKIALSFYLKNRRLSNYAGQPLRYFGHLAFCKLLPLSFKIAIFFSKCVPLSHEMACRCGAMFFRLFLGRLVRIAHFWERRFLNFLIEKWSSTVISLPLSYGIAISRSFRCVGCLVDLIGFRYHSRTESPFDGNPRWAPNRHFSSILAWRLPGLISGIWPPPPKSSCSY